MGVSRYDNEARERRYEARFILVSPGGVETFFRQSDSLKCLRYMGDYDAAALLLDMDRAVQLADLTETQRIVIHLLLHKDMSQKEISKRMNTSQQNISKHIRTAAVSIAAIYESWAWQNEGYFMTDLMRDILTSEEGAENNDI